MPWYFYRNGLPVSASVRGVLETGSITATCLEPTDPLPSGFLFCDGSTVLIADYPDLYNRITTKFNTGGELVTEFRLPDLQGRMFRGTGTGVDLGDTGGAKTHTHVVANHSHSMAQAHSHGMFAGFNTHTHTMAHTHVLSSHRHTGFGLNVDESVSATQLVDPVVKGSSSPGHRHRDNGGGDGNEVIGLSGAAGGSVNSGGSSVGNTGAPNGGSTSGATSSTVATTGNPNSALVPPTMSHLPPYSTLTFLIKT